ncbi:hypothetical protein FB451DRAFT_302690 [Mycena latifolia]|nr:hypothetical protein FB451DRAFT_302690 [Mycena latifolia]
MCSPTFSVSSYDSSSPTYMNGHLSPTTTGLSPRLPPLALWDSMPTFAATHPNLEIATYFQYDPTNVNMGASATLSPVLPHLTLLGSPKFQHRSFEDSSDASPVLSAHASDANTESLLFGPTPPHSDFPPRMFATSRTISDIHVTTSGNDRLMVPPRRHSFAAGPPQRGKFFLASESSTSTPETFSSSFPPSPGTPDGTVTELAVVYRQVASPASVQASTSRRKKPAKFRCPHCPSSFTARHNLRHHVNAHTGARPYHCAVCGTHYTTPSVLTRHLKTCRARRSRSPSTSTSATSASLGSAPFSA